MAQWPTMTVLRPVPLTTLSFAPFGEVIEPVSGKPLEINQGFAKRFDDLAHVDTARMRGSTKVSLFVAQPRPLPLSIALMERHPIGSQLFHPLQDRPWLIVVCGDPEDAASFSAFMATGRQGINYARNVWHHPLLVFDADSQFMVVDRKGPGENLLEQVLAQPIVVDVGAFAIA